jgi:hypothetical protein
MKNKAKKFKFLAKVELISGIILTFVALILYQFRDKISGLEDDYTALYVIFAVGIFSFLNAFILYFLSKRASEKEASPIEY